MTDSVENAKKFRSTEEAIPTVRAINLRRSILDSNRWLDKEAAIEIQEVEV